MRARCGSLAKDWVQGEGESEGAAARHLKASLVVARRVQGESNGAAARHLKVSLVVVPQKTR